MRLATTALAAALAVSTAACSGTPSAAPSSPPAAAGSAAAGSAACEGVYTYAMTRTDDPQWKEFLDHLSNAEKYPLERRLAIRQAYATKQEQAVRPLVAEATDPGLRAALQAYADGWATLAADRTPDGPRIVQPNWQPVLDRCPGLEHRIYTDLEAQGK